MGLVPACLEQVSWRRYMLLITLNGISQGRVNGYLGSIKSFGAGESLKGYCKVLANWSLLCLLHDNKMMVFFNFFIFLLLVVLGMLGKYSTTELYSHPLFTFYFEIGSHLEYQDTVWKGESTAPFFNSQISGSPLVLGLPCTLLPLGNGTVWLNPLLHSLILGSCGSLEYSSINFLPDPYKEGTVLGGSRHLNCVPFLAVLLENLRK